MTKIIKKLNNSFIFKINRFEPIEMENFQKFKN